MDKYGVCVYCIFDLFVLHIFIYALMDTAYDICDWSRIVVLTQSFDILYC